MKYWKRTLLFFLSLIVWTMIVTPAPSYAESNPHSVPTNVKNNWDSIYGGKSYDMRTGKNVVYDVYSKKFTNGGYQIVNRNFGGGSQPYINFQGWAINMGRQHHTSSNNETYIVAQKVGSTTTKIYSTLTLDLSASEDLEYNKSQSDADSVWNRCSNSARNKSNLPFEDNGCNMEYDGVGFDAYLPLNELFPDITKAASWRLFLVKVVNEHIVYTPLILPFDFNNLTYHGGDISLSSGVDANKLIMRSTSVIRRTSRTDTASGATRGYFETGKTYTRVSQNESSIAVWYGVRSPHDNNNTRWASTAYWNFGGEQAILKFVPDDKPPVHIADSVTGHRYRTGSSNYTYWVQPNDELTISLRQQDVDSGNKYQYMRLLRDGNLMVRSRHNFTQDSITEKDNQRISTHVSVNATKRTENTSYGKVEWTVEPKTHDHIYDIQYYYQDKANNTLGYNSTGDKIRVDGENPYHVQDNITGYGYQNGDDYWVQPNKVVNIALRGQDEDSLLNRTYLRLYGSGKDARGVYFFNNSTYDYFYPANGINISSGTKTYESSGKWLKEVTYKAAASTHGDTYNIQYHYQDNVENKVGYINTGMRLRVDGVAPSHKSHSLTGFRYKNGNDYWVKSGDQVMVSLTQNDAHSGNKAQYLRFSGSGVDDRSYHLFSGSTTNYSVLSDYNSTHLDTNSAKRIVNNTDGTVEWKVTPNTHGHTYNVQYYYRDNVENNTNYINTGMRLRTDDVAPSIQFRNNADTADFVKRDWSDSQIDVRLKFSDAHSGYKRSRYAWTESPNTPTNSEWSAWSTSKNYVVNQDKAGEWYLHVQAEDNVGNIITTHNADRDGNGGNPDGGPYQLNTPPELTMTYEPSEVYEGDTVNVCVYPSDADGHKMTVIIEQKIDGVYQTALTRSNVSTGEVVCYEFVAETPGMYEFKGSVDDGIVEEPTSVEIGFEALPLEIEGAVLHTERWNEIHANAGNSPEQFYSGEKFLLEAETTDYPSEYVVAKLEAYQENGQLYQKTVMLNANSTTFHVGELFEQAFMESGTTLKQGIVTFTFEVKYTNGIIKQDPIDIEIIGDVFDSLQFHRKY